MLRLYTIFLTVVLLIPVGAVGLSSLTPHPYVSLPVGEWSGRWYAALFESPRMVRAMGNSVVVAGASAALATVLGAMGGMGLSHLRSATRSAGVALFGVVAAIPALFIALPSLVLLAWTEIPRGRLATVVVLATMLLPMPGFMTLATLGRLDPRLREAAYLLGATRWRTELVVIAPQLFRPLSAAFILTFMLGFDDLTLTYFLGGNVETFPTAVYAMSRFGITPMIMAACGLIFAATGAGMALAVVVGVRKQGP